MINRTAAKRRRMNELYDWDMEDKDEDEVDIFGQLESEEEEEATPVQHCPNKERNHLLRHKKLMVDYFNVNSTYNN